MQAPLSATVFGSKRCKRQTGRQRGRERPGPGAVRRVPSLPSGEAPSLGKASPKGNVKDDCHELLPGLVEGGGLVIEIGSRSPRGSRIDLEPVGGDRGHPTEDS